jgi:intracellular sulfur oxidation DsrE/DsrF family protein
MKRNIIICLLFLAPNFLSAQNTDYKVVFDITSKDSLDHKMVIRLLNEVLKASSDQAQLEVVLYGLSLEMVQTGKSVVADDVMRLAQKKNVAFRICAIAMKNRNVDKSQLLPGVEVVPDGIYEITSKQRDGWAYIKVVH